MNGKLRFALIGAGGIGARWANVIKSDKRIALSFVCDTDTKKADKITKQFNNCISIKDWKEYISSKEIDAVIVALPHARLAPATQAFLKNKKHVLCEKPGGIHHAEIKKAIDIAKKNDVRYMVGFNHRYHDGFQKARKLFERGVIGDILFIRARYGFGGRKDYEKEWRFNKKVSGGGELIDQGVHMIDLARWFLGDFIDVCGFAEDTFWRDGVDDNAFVLLRNKEGRIASIHVSWTQWRPLHNFEIYGTKGYIIIDGLGKKYGGKELLILGKRNNFESSEKTFSCDPDADKSLMRELKEFICAIRECRNPKPNGEDALQTLKIVHSIYSKK